MDEGRPPKGSILLSGDVIAGVVLLAAAAVFMAEAWDLPGSRGYQFGPGTAPTLFIGCLAVAAVALVVRGLLAGRGASAGGFRLTWRALRAPACVLGSILIFAFGITRLGLMATGVIVSFTACAATTEVRWIEATIFSLLFSAACVGLFVVGLDLHMSIWPRF